MAPLAKNGGPQKKSWTAVAVLAVFVMGLLSAAAFAGDVGGGATSSSGTTDTTTTTATATTPAPASTDTGTTSTTPTDTTTTTPAATTTTPSTSSTPTTTAGSSSTFAPSISTDAGVYGPGATVTLTGAGWLAGESVHVFVNDDQGQTWSYTADVTADATGSFTHQFQLPSSFVAVYSVTATGTNGDSSSTQFQDDAVVITFPTAATYNASNWGSGCASAGFCGTANGGNTSAVKLSVRQGGGNYWNGSSFSNSTETFTATTLTATGGNSFNWALAFPFSNFPASGTYTLHVEGFDNKGNAIANDQASVSFSIGQQSAGLAVTSASGTYGGTTNLSATLTSGGSGIANKTINFSLNGTNVGQATTNASGVATLSNASLSGINAGSYPSGVSASFAGDGTFGAASGNGALTVSAKQLTGSFTAANKTYDGTAAATIATRSLTGVVGSDNVSLTGGSASFADKNAGAGKTATGTGFTLSGTAAGNYTLASSTLTTTATISAAAVTGSFTASNKIYDGASIASIATRSLTGAISGDNVSLSGGTATFSDRNVGAGKTVTGTGFTLSGTDAGNYTLTSVANTTADITKRALIVSAAGVDKTYDRTTTATVTLSTDKVSGDIVTAAYTSASFADKNAGSGKTVNVSGISISGSDAGNYNLSNTTASTTASISKRGLTVAAHGVDKTYNGTTAATVTLSDNALAGDTVTDSYATASFADKNVGTSKTVSVSGISIGGADGGNYNLLNTTATTTANITAGSITGSFTASDKTYDGTNAATIASRSLSGAASGDNVSLAGGTATFADKNVGTGKTVTGTGFTLSGPDAANYALASSTLTTTANISAATVSGSFTVSNKTYDGNASATILSRTLGGVFGSDAVSLAGGSAAFADKNAGVGKTVTGTGFSLSGADAANYTLSSVSATTANISPLGVTGSFSVGDKVYDGTAAATVTGTSVNGKIVGDFVALTVASASFGDKNVGNGKTVTGSGFSLAGADAANYALSSVGATTANITPRALHVSATGVDKTYDGATAASVTLADDRLAGDVFTDSYASASFANKNVGSAKPVSVSGISISGADAGDYTFNATASTAANISAKPLTISAHGVNKVYDGTTSATVTLSDDRVAGDLLTSTYGSAAFDSKNVGTAKSVSVSGISISGADAGNYTFNTTASTSADISARTLHVTATGVDKVYDGATAATVTLADDRVSGDVLTASYGSASFATKDVGSTKPVSVSGIAIAGPDAGNYSANTSTSTTADITARVLTIVAHGIDKVYDGNASATVSLSDNRVSGDAISTSYGSAAFADRNVGSTKPVSVSGIAVTGADAGNYTFNTSAGTTAAITARALTVSAAATDKVYDGTTAADVTLSTDKVSGDAVTAADTAASFVDKNVGTGKSVTVSGITISGADAGNYNLLNTTASTTASITKRDLAVVAQGQNKVYDTTAAATVTLTDNRVAGDIFVTGYGTASFADKNVGTGKPVSVSGISITGTDAGNYNLLSTTASTSADITKRDLTVSARGVDKTYDGNADATVTLTDDALAGDTVVDHSTSASFADKNVGNGKPVSVSGISISGSDAGNYNLTNTTATTSADITRRNLIVSAHGQNKVYDGTTAATVSLSDDAVPADTVSDNYVSAAFGDKNVGNSKPVSVSGISISGADAGNYNLVNTTASTTADITKRDLTVTAAGIDKTYDGTTAATVSLSDDRLAGDVVSDHYASAAFADKNVGSSKGVSVSGITISGADAGNYNLVSSTASTTANISAKPLTISAHGVNKVYDGAPSAAVTLTDDRVSGDSVSDAYASASFADKNVGDGKTVSVSGISISGPDAGNYTFNSTASTTADITKRALTVTASGIDKVYDGTAAATVHLSDDQVSGDDVSDGYTAASFADKNVGNAKTVSVSGISISGADAGNYSLQYGTATTTASITRRALTVTATGANKIYDSTTAATVTLHDDRVSGDVVSDSYTGASFADKNVASSKPVSVTGISISGADAANYDLQNGTAAATADITPAALHVSATGIDKVYDGTTKATVTLGDDRFAGDSLSTSYASASFADANAGSAKAISVSGVAIGGPDSGNYALANTTTGTTANITARAITITADAKSKTYGDVDPALTYQVTSGSLVSGDTFSGSLDRQAGQNVGQYDITEGTVALSPNYTLTYVGAKLTITKRPVTITADAKSKTYGEPDPALTYQITSGSLAYTDAFTGSLTRATGQAVASYAITQGSVALSENYDLSYVGANLTIDRRPISITADDKSKVYGEDDPALTFHISSGSLAYTDGFTGSLARNAGRDIGNYTITQGTVRLSSNYDLSYVPGTLTITKRPISITADAKTKVYGEDDPALTFHISSGSLAYTDAFAGSLSRDAAQSVGDYTVTQGSVTLSDNYTLTYTGAKLSITKRPITVTADPQTKVYGEADPALTYKVTSGSLAYNDAFSGSLSRDAGQNVGTYAIVQDSLTAGANYTLTYVGANLTITKRPVTITADAKSKTYGDGDPALTYQITSGTVVPGDAFSGALTRDAGQDVGSYDIKVGTVTLSGNYTLTYVGANLTITKRPVTITADAKSKTYGDPDPALTYQITSGSLAYSDGVTGSLARDAGQSVGSYTINQGTVALSSNYNLTYVGAKLTITARPISIVADPQTKVYGDADPALTYHITSGSLAYSDAFTGSLARDPGQSVGQYNITQGTLALSGNYTLGYTGAQLTITKRPITVTADPQTKVYGTADPMPLTYKITSGSLAYSDTFSGSLSRAGGQNVGTYAIVQDSLSAGSNYTLTYVGANLTITQRPITITADPQTKVYGNADPALTWKITSGSLVAGDATSGSLTRAAGETVAGSPYAISQGTLTAGANYNLTYVPANLTITKAPLTVNVANASKLLNAPNPAFTGTIVGIKLADNITATYSTTATQTSPVGTYPINASLVDPDGKLPNYTVTITPGTLSILYRWDGFLQPINDTAHTQATMSVFKSGSTVPVKFQLKDTNGNVVQAATLPLWVTPVKVGTTTQPVDESTYSDLPSSGQTYRWDGSQYIYNWQSPKDPGGLYRICAKFEDGQTQCVNLGLK